MTENNVVGQRDDIQRRTSHVNLILRKNNEICNVEKIYQSYICNIAKRCY